MVIGLASLLAPFGFEGDMRPYVTSADKDAKHMRAAASRRKVNK